MSGQQSPVDHVAMDLANANMRRHQEEMAHGSPRAAAAMHNADSNGVPHIVGGSEHMLEGGAIGFGGLGQDSIDIFPDRESMDVLTRMPGALADQEISMGAHEFAKGMAEAAAVSQPMQGANMQMHPMSASFNVPQKVGAIDHDQHMLGNAR